ncbi:hypothetical protein CYMTET_45698 [Cymbomonas tetramitiformis]|uniref:Kinesin motor domain-containing protein n=1 Tax=Cymbomonas tetramitiformis TaxID=36881 RepID=A0AAE0EYC5_9CHLO|nr:hypothetical protein CYMTET_45698 [Cymbomonas tetramitiformis]
MNDGPWTGGLSTCCGTVDTADGGGVPGTGRTHATGLTLTEAQNINNSLLSLGNVISALVTGGSHVPYRNSKLTMILQDSLGGDAKALMVCNLAPSSVHASETLSSLQFAQKVSAVELRTPRRNLEDAESDKKKAMMKKSAALAEDEGGVKRTGRATSERTSKAVPQSPTTSGRGFFGFGGR